MQYDVFICHASEDKKDFVNDFAQGLKKVGLKIWYDDSTLQVGDKLREKIDEGIQTSKYVVVILSKAFFKTKGWASSELEAILAKETAEGKTIILPIWHKVDHQDVQKFSPILSGKFAIKTTTGIQHVIEQILLKIAPWNTWVGELSFNPLTVGMDYYHGREPKSTKAFEYWQNRGVSYYPIEEKLGQNTLRKLDVIFLSVSHAREKATNDEVEVLNDWIRSGGIFIANPLVWVTKSSSNIEPNEAAVNLLVKSAGIFFSDEYLHNQRFDADVELLEGHIGFSRNTMTNHPITEGVEKIAFSGVPGVTTIQQGTVIIWGELKSPGKTTNLPYMVVVSHGKGTIIAFQHGGILNDDCFTSGRFLAQFDNVKLWHNMLNFIQKKRIGVREVRQ
jgi:hypothetical protein